MKIAKSAILAVSMFAIAAAAPQLASAKATVLIKPHALAFGKTAVGTTSVSKTVTLINKTAAEVTLASPSITGPFTIPTGGSTCGTSLAGGASCTISLVFAPTSATNPKGTAEHGTLEIVGGARGRSETLNLAGVAFASASDPPPTSTATPTPVSATEAGTAAVLKGLGNSAKTVVDGDKLYVELVALQLVQTPGLIEGIMGGATPPADHSIDGIRSWLADRIVHFETAGLYGDTKAELPRATCDFTADSSGDCIPNPNALVITYKDAFGLSHTTTFDWTGASTGTASPTVQGHDPLNPAVSFELPARMAFTFTTVSPLVPPTAGPVISLVTDTAWHPSPCVPGEVLFDIGDGGDAAAFVTGLDGITKIIDVPKASVEPASTGTALFSFTGSASGGGASVNGSATVPVTGSLDRSGTCGALEGATVTSLTVDASAADGAGDSNRISFAADNFTAPSEEQSGSADLSNGEFWPDATYGTFAGTLNDANGDGIWGDDVTIQFAEGAVSLEQFLIDEFGATPD